ncbi:MAG: L,D-transpeptidase family protein, partial [Candidatus Nanopelagicales bacterium]
IATKVALTTVPAAAVDAGKVLTLRAVVSPAVGGTVRFTDGARLLRTVGLAKGVATLAFVPSRGSHWFRAWFVPGSPAAYAASASPVVKATSGAARVLPLVAGSFGPLVALAQNRLVWNGIPLRVTGTYDAATIAGVKRFQGKFFLRATGVTDARTMSLLAKLAVRVPPRSCTSVRISICVDKTRKIAQLIVGGRVVISIDARFGSTSSPALQTREGIFRVQRKDATHISSEFHTPMPWSMFFSGGQAVHYSKYFAAVGYNGASHGCVNTRDWYGVKKMFSLVSIGTRVVVYRS